MKKIIYTLSAIILLQGSCSLLFAQTASVSCPGNVTVSTRPGYCTSVVNNIDAVISPSGAVVNYSLSGRLSGNYVGSASGTSFPAGITTVTYSLPDYPGVTCSFTVTVIDNEPPVITCPLSLDVTCAEDVPPLYLSIATAVDNCSGQVEAKFLNETRINQTCINRFTLIRTFKATDDAGNTSTCSQVINVNDNEPPHFDQPPPPPVITVASIQDVPAVLPDTYTAIDYCIPFEEDDHVDVIFRQVKSDSTCPGRYTLTRTWTAADWCGNEAVYTQVIHVKDTIGPVIDDSNLPSSLTYSCASSVSDPPSVTATDNNTGEVSITFTEVKSDEQCANKFKLTRTWTATDACGNTSKFSQVITVNDIEPPVFVGTEPTSVVSVSCTEDIPEVPAQTATDNCGTATVTYSETKTNVQCINRYTLTRKWTATDACGNTVDRTQVVNVYDNEPPKVTAISADPVVLWPPNHKMRDVTINYTATDNCGVSSTLEVSSSDPVRGGSDGDQSPDWEVVDAHHVRLRAEKANNGQARFYTIKITISDGCNPPVDTSVTVVVAHNITSPQTGNPFKVGSSVSFNGVFWDKPGNKHTAKWLIDGNVAANGTVTEPSGNQNGKVAGNYKFNSPGVYKLQMNVTDQLGVTSYANTNNDLDAIVVVYNPDGGYTYGGGYYNSPAGALTSNPSAEGKASYGFTVNYFKNSTNPKGETQFEFKVGEFEFNALNYDYLVINNAMAQFKGTGKIIGGQSGIGFTMTVADGQLDGTGIDKVRMKIYNKTTGTIIYDNQPGASDASLPTQGVGTNSVIVIQNNGPNNNLTTKTNNEMVIGEMTGDVVNAITVNVYPNPASSYFKIMINSMNAKERIAMQVFDQYGRSIETKTNVSNGSMVRLGDLYRPGIYYVRILQGKQHRELKLVKLSD